MNSVGYEEAVKYLKEVNEYDKFLGNGTSVDGYSLIAWANVVLNKRCVVDEST